MKVSAHTSQMPGVQSLVRADGVIEQYYIGNQSQASVLTGIHQIYELIKELGSAEILILVDITKLGETTSSARKIGLKAISQVPYTRVAMYGHRPGQALVNLLTFVAGKQNQIRTFSHRGEALAWLKDNRLDNP